MKQVSKFTKSIGIVSLIAISSCYGVNLNKVLWPKIESHIKKNPKVENQIQSILKNMTLEEKVGQMVQAEIKHATPEDVKKYHLGSVLNGGGSFPNNNKYASIKDWLKLADSYYTASVDKANGRAGIPIIWGTDAVHGHNNVMGATIFPHNIGLGAMDNPKVLEQIGQITALEVLSTGIDWVFAPTVAVARNDRWGRAYEAYAENPMLVKKLAGPMVYGLQGRDAKALGQDNVISTAKHFIGDGGTFNGIDQGDNRSTEQELLDIHGQGYITALEAGAQTVMATFNSWKGKKIHGSRYLLTEVLKNKMGFDGFVIGDWNGHGQVKGCSNDSCAQAINAGVDMLMAPQDWKALIKNTINDVKAGKITQARIDDAVTRILRVKLRANLFTKGIPSKRKHANSNIGITKSREIARQAVRESLVLLKNKKQILPLNPKSTILVAGSVAHDIGRQSGGWTLTWQGTGNQNSDFPGGTSIYDGVKKVTTAAGGKAILSKNGTFNKRPDAAIVVFGERPYAEGQGDLNDLNYGLTFAQDLAILKKLKKEGIPVISVFITGRPLWVNPEINASDAFVVAWLPGTEGVGVSDVLFKTKKAYDFKGKLPFSWPNHAMQSELNLGQQSYKPLFKYGYGLTYKDSDNLGDNLSEQAYPGGSAPAPAEKLTVFKGRTYSPFVSYVGDYKNWKKPLNADMGASVAGLVTVISVDKDIQEDARQITFKGGDSNFYFQADTNIDLSSYTKNGVIKLDIRIDKRPNNEANILMGLAKVNFNNYLNVEAMKKWETIAIPLKCFVDKGADFKNFNMPLSFATFGSMQLSIANVDVLKNRPKTVKEFNCK